MNPTTYRSGKTQYRCRETNRGGETSPPNSRTICEQNSPQTPHTHNTPPHTKRHTHHLHTTVHQSRRHDPRHIACKTACKNQAEKHDTHTQTNIQQSSPSSKHYLQPCTYCLTASELSQKACKQANCPKKAIVLLGKPQNWGTHANSLDQGQPNSIPIQITHQGQPYSSQSDVRKRQNQ